MGSGTFALRAALSCAAALGVSKPALGADETIHLTASGQWYMEYEADSCRLSRLFGEGEDQVALIIERYAPGDMFHMVVAGKPLGDRRRSETRVQFGAQDVGYDYEPLLGALAEHSLALVFSTAYPTGERAKAEFVERPGREKYEESLDPNIFAHKVSDDRLAAIAWVAFERRGEDRVLLELPQFGEAMASMRKCTEELVSHWGIDVEAHRSLTKLVTPLNNPGDWLQSRDYPRDLLNRGYQGIVRFRLSVDARGNTTACHIQDSTRPEGFDKVVCEKIMQRAKFEPALDKDGKPIASFYRNTVHFQI